MTPWLENIIVMSRALDGKLFNTSVSVHQLAGWATFQFLVLFKSDSVDI